MPASLAQTPRQIAFGNNSDVEQSAAELERDIERLQDEIKAMSASRSVGRRKGICRALNSDDNSSDQFGQLFTQSIGQSTRTSTGGKRGERLSKFTLDRSAAPQHRKTSVDFSANTDSVPAATGAGCQVGSTVVGTAVAGRGPPTSAAAAEEATGDKGDGEKIDTVGPKNRKQQGIQETAEFGKIRRICPP